MTHTAATDEDAWEVPAQWRAKAIGFRGDGTDSTVETDPQAWVTYRELVEQNLDYARDVLARSAKTEWADLSEAGSTALESPAEANPLGAAVLARILQSRTESFAVADAWLNRYGIAFAAEAVVHAANLGLDHEWDPVARTHRQLIRRYYDIRPLTADLLRLRAHLAVLPEPEYAALADQLGELRGADANLAIRVNSSVLFPTRRDWVREDVAVAAARSNNWYGAVALLAASCVSWAEVEPLITGLDTTAYNMGTVFLRDRVLLCTMVTRFGPDCAEILGKAIAAGWSSAAEKREFAGVLAHFPTDRAFELLLARADLPTGADAILTAAKRFPRRAMRMLTADTSGRASVRLLRQRHATVYPELAAEFGIAVAAPEYATLAQLPEPLRGPLRAPSVARPRPVVLTVPHEPAPNSLDWAPGEQAEWAATEVILPPYLRDGELGSMIDRALDDIRRRGHELVRLFALAPAEIVEPLLRTAPAVHNSWGRDEWRRLLGRFGDDALRFVLASAQLSKHYSQVFMLPIIGTEVTGQMAHWLSGKANRDLAVAWFDRNYATAAPDLIAMALAKPGKERKSAESALRELADKGHRAVILSAAADFGEPVREAITALLDTPPPAPAQKIPTLPNWLAPQSLPPLTLRADGAIVPPDAVVTFCTMLAMARPEGEHPALADVAAALRPEARARFVWAVFEMWEFVGCPAKDRWVLQALGALGDDETARRLEPLIRLWPSKSGGARAIAALDVLTRIGTDTALLQLHTIAEKAKTYGLREEAKAKMREVAAARGLTTAQLADRLVPDFGLSANGTLALDYGPRGFVIGLDEQLMPVVFDAVRGAEGEWTATTRRGTLPKPGAKDDPESAAAAYQIFTVMRKGLKTAAADQIRRSERAMIIGRRWSVAEHRRLFIRHPLMRQLAQRLVWATFDESDTPTGAFRIAEDGTYADLADDAVALPDTAKVGIAHPLELGDSIPAWAEVFSDYAVLQPFSQLDRDFYAPNSPEISAGLERFSQAEVSTGKVLALSNRAWSRESIGGGVIDSLTRPLDERCSARISLDPGMPLEDPMGSPQQVITVDLTDGTTFGTLHPVVASELLRDLASLHPTLVGER